VVFFIMVIVLMLRPPVCSGRKIMLQHSNRRGQFAVYGVLLLAALLAPMLAPIRCSCSRCCASRCLPAPSTC
jgi:hypothetical protein